MHQALCFPSSTTMPYQMHLNVHFLLGNWKGLQMRTENHYHLQPKVGDHSKKTGVLLQRDHLDVYSYTVFKMLPFQTNHFQ